MSEDKKMVFFKWWPDDVLNGCALLTWQSELTYRRIIDNIYTSDNSLFDDEFTWQVLTSKFNGNVEQIKDELIIKKKIYIDDGFIKNKACNKYLTEAKLNNKTASDKGKKGADARWNSSSNAQVMPTTNHKPLTTNQLTINYNNIKDTWNKIIPTSHLTQMNDTRKKLFKSRYKDFFKGKEEGWIEFCTKISKIKFLWGDNSKSWKADFNWVLNENNLLKILEGKYTPDAVAEKVTAQRTYKDYVGFVKRGQHTAFIDDGMVEDMLKDNLITKEEFNRW